MQESTAIIASALIAGGAAALSVAANEIFRYIAYRREVKERLAQALLPYRLDAANEIFRAIAKFGPKVFDHDNAGDIQEGLGELYNNLSNI